MSAKKHNSLQRQMLRRKRRHATDEAVAEPPRGAAHDFQTALRDLSLAHPTTQTLRQGTMQRLQTDWGNASVQRFLTELGPIQGFALAQRQTATEEETTAGNPSAPATPGTSTHPTVRSGSRGSAVEELQQKLNADGAAPELVVDGIFGPKTRAAVVAFQTKYSLEPDGVVGPITWGKIDELGLSSTVGRVEKEWTEEVGGQTYGMTSRYTWRIVGSELRVTVNLKFVGLNRPALVERWFSYIRSIWNRFDAVNDAGERITITFDPQSVTSGEDNVVRIRPGEGRSDAANWFAGDPDSDNTAAHEFGHMIGLEDEYQRNHTDYKRLTGEEPQPGDENAADPDDVAQQMRAALLTDDQTDRVQQCNQVIQDNNLRQGVYAQQVAEKYQEQFGIGLVQDIVARIPDEDEFPIVDPFTHTSDSIMGGMDDHEHPTEPRHVREFVGYISQAQGGSWVAEER